MEAVEAVEEEVVVVVGLQAPTLHLWEEVVVGECCRTRAVIRHLLSLP